MIRLPEGWTLTTEGEVDVLRGPVVQGLPDEEHAWVQQVIEVSVDTNRLALVNKVEYWEPYLIVAGVLTPDGMDDWPDVTRHFTLTGMAEELGYYLSDTYDLYQIIVG